MNILDIKNRYIDHLTETIWWNKGLTKLNEDTISNYNEFIDNLVQVKGPYLEKVQPPKFSNQPWPDYCERHGIQHEVQSAIRDVVFGGGDGRLYRHQGRAVGSILDSVHGDTEDDVIITAGYRIGPDEIEDTIAEHKDVLDAGVIGIPDSERGEVPKAFVTLVDESTPSDELRIDLKEHVKSRLATYEYPREVEFVTELPTTVTGKIQRSELREREGLN
jgi:acyl-CoA synthetase (AMP-forming)/AMP-acid ligase II